MQQLTESRRPGLKTLGGDTAGKSCAGERATLIPDNDYDEAVLQALQEHMRFSGDSQVILAHSRSTVCDVEGHFEFDNVPAQKWMVDAFVKWEAPSQFGMAPQGGELTQHDTLTAGVNKVILSQGDLSNF